MQKIKAKKLALRVETLRTLRLSAVRGGAINQPTHGCTASCNCGGGGGNTGANGCINTEFTCQTCSCGC